LNPPKPNDKLKFAAEYYKSKVEETRNLKTHEQIKNPVVNDTPISREESQIVFKSRADILSEMMEKDQELGLYDPPYDNPLIKSEITPALSDEEVKEMFMDEWERKFDMVEEEENENFSTIEPTQEEENENFSTMEPISENIFQDDWNIEIVPETSVTTESLSVEPTKIEGPSSDEDEKKN